MLFVVEYHGGQKPHLMPPSIVSLLVGFQESCRKMSVASDRHFVRARSPISA